MRNKIKSLLGRNLFNTAKFKPLVSLAITRIAVLKHQRQARRSQARSDVLQLLHQGNHQRALLRVEQVIKEQNTLDVYDMLEGHCNLLIERIHLIENERECPDELREATSSMLYAASRCGDFPELQEIRTILTSHFGKEFTARAVELRNNCGVNHTMILKLSTRQPSLESRMLQLKEIASENNIVLQLDEDSTSISALEKKDTESQGQASPSKCTSFSDSVKAKKKYKDVADAAQAAFESAAYAAAAARAAVELSRSGHDSDTHHSPKSPPPNSNSNSVQMKRSLSSSSSDSAVNEGIENESTENETQVTQKSDDESVGMRLDLDKVPFSMRTRRLRGF